MARTPAGFVVLTTQRSGSVWLISTLNNLEGVTAHGEQFLPRARSRERRWDSDFARPRFVEAEVGTRIRPFSVFSYLNDLYRGSDTVGFKLMYSQLWAYPEILLYLISRGIRVVHLVRRNHLDVLISQAVKSRLGRAHVLPGQSRPPDLQVELDTRTLVRQMERLEWKQRIARRAITWSHLPHEEVAYEDLIRDRETHLRRITDFLSLPPAKTIPESAVVRIRQGGQRETVRNFEEVREVLGPSRFAGLLE